MVEMTNGAVVHNVKDEDVQHFENNGWKKVEKPKRKPKEEK